jgi:hypothetical protein
MRFDQVPAVRRDRGARKARKTGEWSKRSRGFLTIGLHAHAHTIGEHRKPLTALTTCPELAAIERGRVSA